MNQQRSKVRRIISFLIGIWLAVAGGFGFIWMLLFSHPVMMWVWLVPITLMGGGVSILYDELKNP